MIDILYAADDAEQINEIETYLLKQGHDVSLIDCGCIEFKNLDNKGIGIIFISNNLLKLLSDEMVDCIIRTYENRLIPLLLDGTDSRRLPKQLGSMSYIDLKHGAGYILALIEIVTQAGNTNDIMAWNNYRLSAVKWEMGGKPKSGLLNSGEIMILGGLLNKPVSELPDSNANLINELFNVSRIRLRKIKQRISIIFTIVLVMVAASGITASILKVIADAEAASALFEAAMYESERLADQAIALMYSDPDLPWILADRAVNTVSPPSPKSLMATRAVTGNLIAHTSRPLRAPAASVCALSQNRIAVGFQINNGFTVIDSTNGEVVFDALNGDGNTTVASNPGGTCFFVISSGSGRVEVYSSFNVPELLYILPFIINSPPIWIDNENALCISDGQLVLLHVFTGNASSFTLPDSETLSETGIVSAAISEEGAWIALATRNKVFVYSTESVYIINEKIDEIEIPNIRYIIPNHHQNALYVERGSDKLIVIEGIGNKYETRIREIDYHGGARASRSVMVDESGHFYFGDSLGYISVLAYPSNIPAFGAIKAHNGQVTGIAGLNGGSWATVGADSMLRVWMEPIFGGNINTNLFYDSMIYDNVWPGLEESKRYTIGAVYGENTAAAVMPNGMGYSIINRDDLSTERFNWLWANITRAKTASSANMIAAFRGGVNSISLTPSHAPETTVSFANIPIPWIDLSLFDLSPDGTECAAVIAILNNRGHMAIWSVNEPEPVTCEFTADANAVYVAALGDQNALTVSALGTVTYIDGRQYSLFNTPTLLSAAAALSGDRIITLDNKGNLYIHEMNPQEIWEKRVLTSTPDLIGGFVIEVSPDNKLAAVIGKGCTVIINIETGEVASVIYPLSLINSDYPVHDILFDEDGTGAIIVRSNGWISRIKFPGDTEAIEALREALPRELTENEELAFGG
ncbi:MAG: hypothetical protein FWE91_09500 [Defluviitaleaceae bacterium]|nr:hypothetical protein [Defluviitaleaceae bacterium]